jgi:ABC-type transporter Mla subunit MlaD
MQLAKELVVKFKQLANLLKQATTEETTQVSHKELVTSSVTTLNSLMQKTSELMIRARPFVQKLLDEVPKFETLSHEPNAACDMLMSISNISDALTQLLAIAKSKYENVMIDDKEKAQLHQFEQYAASINSELIFIYRLRLNGSLNALEKNENKFLRLVQCIERSVSIVGDLFNDEN